MIPILLLTTKDFSNKRGRLCVVLSVGVTILLQSPLFRDGSHHLLIALVAPVLYLDRLMKSLVMKSWHENIQPSMRISGKNSKKIIGAVGVDCNDWNIKITLYGAEKISNCWRDYQ